MDRKQTAVEAATEGAALAKKSFRTKLSIGTKRSAVDYVTDADMETQERIVQAIAEGYPNDVVVAEEGEERKSVPESGPAWLVDPIDGTTNYIRGIPLWATSVAALVDGEVVAAANLLPALNERFVAGADGIEHDGSTAEVSSIETLHTGLVAPLLRYGHEYEKEYRKLLDALSPHVADFRRLGSAQTTLSLVADGELDAAVGIAPSNPWDTVAGVNMIKRAGGRVTDASGAPWTPRSEELVATNGAIHDEVLEILP